MLLGSGSQRGQAHEIGLISWMYIFYRHKQHCQLSEAATRFDDYLHPVSVSNDVEGTIVPSENISFLSLLTSVFNVPNAHSPLIPMTNHGPLLKIMANHKSPLILPSNH